MVCAVCMNEASSVIYSFNGKLKCWRMLFIDSPAGPRLSVAQNNTLAIKYATESGNEPVKESLLELGRPIKTIVGEDIRFVELN